MPSPTRPFSRLDQRHLLLHTPAPDSMADAHPSNVGGVSGAPTAALPYPPGSGGPGYPALDMGTGGRGGGGGDGAPAGVDDSRRGEHPPEAPWLQEGLVQLWPHISLITEVR